MPSIPDAHATPQTQPATLSVAGRQSSLAHEDALRHRHLDAAEVLAEGLFEILLREPRSPAATRDHGRECGRSDD